MRTRGVESPRAAGRPTRSSTSGGPSPATPSRGDRRRPSPSGSWRSPSGSPGPGSAPRTRRRPRSSRTWRPRRRPDEGLLKLGHIPSCSVRQEPVEDPGPPEVEERYIPAHATAKSVIASANRLIEFRHVCRRSRRIAEISVPACPMPIHQTKQTMSQPQPTGCCSPDPDAGHEELRDREEEEHQEAEGGDEAAEHHFGVWVAAVRTTSERRSVTVPGCAPARGPAAAPPGTPEARVVVRRGHQPASRSGFGFLTWPGRKCGAGCSARPGASRSRVRLQARHARGGVVDVPEDDRLGRQVCWQAVRISPSLTGRPSRSAAILARLIR